MSRAAVDAYACFPGQIAVYSHEPGKAVLTGDSFSDFTTDPAGALALATSMEHAILEVLSVPEDYTDCRGPADHGERLQGGASWKGAPAPGPVGARSGSPGPHSWKKESPPGSWSRLTGEDVDRGDGERTRPCRHAGSAPSPPFFSLVVAACSFPASPRRPRKPRIASYNMERLGQNTEGLSIPRARGARNDLVAAEEVMNAEGMSRLLGTLGSGSSDFDEHGGRRLGRRYQEHFGFFSTDAVEMVSVIGAHPGHDFRPPFGARFKARSSGLAFTLVACHIIYGRSEKVREAEIARLGEVYRWFEERTGGGVTRSSWVISTTRGPRTSRPWRRWETATWSRTRAPPSAVTVPDHEYDHMFFPPALRSRVVSADVDAWTTDYAGTRLTVSDHFPVYARVNVDGEGAGRERPAMRAGVTERYYRFFTGQPVDRIPDVEFGWWPQTIRRWLGEGLPRTSPTNGSPRSSRRQTRWTCTPKLEEYFGFDSPGLPFRSGPT